MKKATVILTIPDVTHEEGAEIINDLDTWLSGRLRNTEFEIETNVSRRWLNKLRRHRPVWGVSTKESRRKAVG